MTQQLGDFEIVREIGRGGMGVVYEARQLSLDRKVALKVLAAGIGMSPKGVQRFRREAHAAAKLHHTNIVPVYASGEADGVLYYAMERIEGPSLDVVLRQLREAAAKAASGGRKPPDDSPNQGADAPRSPVLDQTGPYVPGGDSTSPSAALSASSLRSGGEYFDSAARMIADVADALEHAHQSGVVHRDVKPSNLLLSPDGRLSVTDFGLARVLEEPGMTVSGEFVGTPAYMSPEQIAAGRLPLDHRTDVYSLGATLYELLTLEPPFRGKTREQVLAQIVQKDPRPPRKVNKRVPVDLETICLKALEKDPDRRYQTAGAMAEDLRRYVNRFAIAAKRVGPLGRMRKWVRRHPALAATLAVALVLAAAAGFFAYQAYAAEQRRLAQQKEAEQKLLAEQRQNALDKAIAAAMSGDLEAADKAIAEAERAGASPGEVRLLRGQVAFHRGDLDAAIPLLEQAVDMMPQSAWARGMLAIAYSVNMQTESMEQAMREVERLTPVTPEDYLYKGCAVAIYDPSRGMQMMDEALRQHDSPEGRATRAMIRSTLAFDTADPKDAELAVTDATVAKAMLPNNPGVLYPSIMAELAAAGAYEETGQKEKREAALTQAGNDAQALERYGNMPAPFWGRFMYYYATKQYDACGALSRKAAEAGTTGLCIYGYAWDLYRHGQFEKALEVTKRRKMHDCQHDLAGAFCLLELPDGEARALEAYKILAARYPNGSGGALCPSVLYLLGHKAQAQEAYRELRKQDNSLFDPIGLKTYDYACGDLSAEDLLHAVEHHKFWLCVSHYQIALSMLADGDRKGALHHFQEAIATRSINTFNYDWSIAFSERLEKDPTWPHWIPVKK